MDSCRVETEYEDDPRHLAFSLARYAWVAKMLAGYERVLEVGCGNGLKSRVVAQAVGYLIGIDPDRKLIAAAKKSFSSWPIAFTCQSALDPLPAVDAVYSLDVFEHIAPAKEGVFLGNLRDCAPVCILGTPSLESQVYASPESRSEHVNCLSGEALKAHLLEHWSRVFMFSGHDTVITASYLPMSHYLLALCIR